MNNRLKSGLPLADAPLVNEDMGRLRFLLEDHISYLDADDIENASDEFIESVLNRYGLASPRRLANAAALENFEQSAEDARSDHPADDWIIKRPKHVAAALEKLQSHRCVTIDGPRGSGKSHFWRQDLRRSRDFSALFDAAVVVDCFSLRTRSRRILEHDALYAQFGSNEKSYRAFLGNLKAEADGQQDSIYDSDKPLCGLITKKFEFCRGIVVLDHAEYLANDPQIENWLHDLLAMADELDFKILILHGGDNYSLVRRKLSAKVAWHQWDAFDLDEIETWWARPRFTLYREAGLTARNIKRVTGGWPRLVRDFGRYLQQEEENSAEIPVGNSLLYAFARLSSGQVAPEAERLLQVMCEFPQVIVRPKRVRNPSICERLTQTGAMVVGNDGHCAFRSPIISKRYGMLVQFGQLRNLIHKCGDDAHLSTHKMQEVIGEQLCTSLMRETCASAVWRRLERILSKYSLCDIKLYVRDRANSKLWSDAHGHAAKEVWPLYSDDNEDFALAVQSGRVVFRKFGNLFLPVVGENGRVMLVIECRFNDDVKMGGYDRRVRCRSIWRLIRAISPGLALAVERHEHKLANRERRETHYRGNDHLFEQMGCAAVLVISREDERWMVSDARVPKRSEKNKISSRHWKELMTEADTREMDKIAIYPSKIGVVLDRDDLSSLFPRMRSIEEDVSVFIRPIGGPSEPSHQMVAFVFSGRKAHELGGVRQSTLSNIAPLVVNAA